MNENLVLVTGMSGAGKSSAMNALEDLGYCCIDNFPRELLPQLQELLEKEQDRYKNIALSVSAADYTSFVNYFDNIARELQIIFLDCSDEELLLRYRFTRRQHPMIASGQATTLEDAIEMERLSFDQILANMNNTLHVDTTKLSSQALINRIRHRFKSTDKPEFTVTFQSFGFKHGMPMDADMVLDVGFCPIPSTNRVCGTKPAMTRKSTTMSWSPRTRRNTFSARLRCWIMCWISTTGRTSPT